MGHVWRLHNLPDQEDILNEISARHKDKKWKNEFEFNISIAEKILLLTFCGAEQLTL